MSIDDVLATLRGFEGVLELAPGEGSGFPELAWGDHFFYHSPSGVVPERTQPYATIVTKDYPGEPSSDLDRPGRYRVNVHVGRTAGELVESTDRTATDVVLAHPVYGGWVSVVNPGEHTRTVLEELLARAHAAAAPRA
ncbi:DUF6194 family protein [Pseudonocardia sp. WMMC193]|uniref:DUF6194 family protein n=1 Tax=Pseudonocardia sp. WMMC193 TaxID=2911965 RepID=UPI001F34A8A5|nr:DUF6194 family protein [Pseudonocardia sp. WMMC193]MCF7550362.1 DUF6194 family protein [Pseudonocardia sp. WMMC193]